MLGLLMGLFSALMLGIAALFAVSHISLWIWAFPLFAIYIAGTISIFVRGDRIVVAKPGKHDSHALSSDA